jgi:hypothetical protein
VSAIQSDMRELKAGVKPLLERLAMFLEERPQYSSVSLRFY